MKLKICKICKHIYQNSNFKTYCSRICYENRPNSYLATNSIISNCLFCNKEVLKYKSDLRKNPDAIYCNNKCATLHSWKITDPETNSRRRLPTNQKVEYACTYCDKKFLKYKGTVHSEKVFCSHKCVGTYYSKFSKRKARSNLELFISKKLEENFPYLEVIHSDKNQCNGLELDFYFPAINLAIEINGPVHYLPIYGDKYLLSIQERDERKKNICLLKHIALFHVQTTGRFYNHIGESIWSEHVKPKLRSYIPFCEPLTEIKTEFEMISPKLGFFKSKKKVKVFPTPNISYE